MREVHRLDRRTFLVDLGKGVVAVAVLGAGAACGGGSDPSASSSTTTGTSPSEGTGSSTTTGASSGQAALTYRRVDLGVVAAYLLMRGTEVALVDTGLEGSADKIGEALSAASRGWGDVRHVVFTHLHPDHIGSSAVVLERAQQATPHAGAADISAIKSPRTVQPVGDGDEVLGLQVIATPGHTLGHVSVFDPGSGLLVVGDAMNNKDDKLAGSNPQYTADAAQAVQSVKKLAALEFTTIAFGHGLPIEERATEVVRQFAATL